MHHSSRSSRARQYRQNPVNIGLLIDLYLRHKSYVVIHSYLSSYSLTEEQKESYEELKIDISNNRQHAKEIFQNVQITRWRSLPEDLRQTFKIAAVGNSEEAVAVSCNLGPRAAKRAVMASRGAADYVGRKIREIAGLLRLSPEIALVLENISDRQGCNPGLHFHAALRIPSDQVPQLREALTDQFAFDYMEVASNQAGRLQELSATRLLN